jgi:superfamily II DNA helicase RecQ
VNVYVKQARVNAAEGFRRGEIRILFATEAYSMGTDVRDIRRVVHVGAPTSLESKL